MARSLYDITGDIKDVNTMLVPLQPTEAMLDAACDFDARAEAEKENKRRFPSLRPFATAGQILAIQWREMLEEVKQ